MPFKVRGRTRKLVLAGAVAVSLAGTGAALAWPAGGTAQPQSSVAQASAPPSSVAPSHTPPGHQDKQHRQDKQDKHKQDKQRKDNPGKQHAAQKPQDRQHKGRNSGDCHEPGSHSEGRGWNDGRWPGLPDGR